MKKPPPKETCAYCDYYTFKHRLETGWAYCKFFKKHFPDQFSHNPEVKPAGKRTCPNFK